MNNIPKRFDAFVSYNSRDSSAVEALVGQLQRAGLHLYLEQWELAPGREFQPALAEGLRDSNTCVVFYGPNGLGPWQKQEIQVAIDKRARDSNFHVVPVLLPGVQRPRRGNVAHLEFLINASWVEFLTTLDDDRAFRRLVWGITGAKPDEPADSRYTGLCPYRGLESFRIEDAPFFFGREALTGWLVSALRREVRSQQGVRFLAVLGPSGSGKSSVVLAGLVPLLKAGATGGSERWSVVVFRPGDDPLQALTEKLVPRLREVRSDLALSESAEQKELLADLRAEGSAAERELNRHVSLKFADEPEERRLLIVVDQFEEVFTYQPRDELARVRFERERSALFANLLNAAAAPNGQIAVVVTMRSDFVGSCAPFPQLAAVLSAHQELVGPMTRDELREVIERPAFLVGCEVEPALVERLLADVEGQKGALPLLQFTLTECWKKRDVRRLTLATYEKLGGVAGALERRANEIFDRLDDEQQKLCRQLLLRLVQPGEGTEDTKRRVSYRELLPRDPARAAAIRKLVQLLAARDTRLLTTEGDEGDGGVVEVVHEALVRGWAQLRRWLFEGREGLRIQRRLTEAAKDWAAARAEERSGYLHTGPRLAVCREWAEAHTGELSPDEEAFLKASAEAERQHQQMELETERQLRETAEAARSAEQQRAEEAEIATVRQKRLGRRWRIAAGIAVLLALTAGVLGWLAWSSAKTAENEAEKMRLIAIPLALDAGEIEDANHLLEAQPESRRRFEWYHWWHLCHRDQIPQVSGHHYQVWAAAFVDNTTLISATGEWQRPVEVMRWDLTEGKGQPVPLNEFPLDPITPEAVTISPNGQLLALATGEEVRFWEVGEQTMSPKKCKSFSGQPGCFAFSTDGTRLAGTTGIWDWQKQDNYTPYPQRITASAVAFNTDGALALAVGPRVVLVPRTGTSREFPAAAHLISYLTFSSDGRFLAAGTEKGTVQFWDVPTGTVCCVLSLSPAGTRVTSLAFAPGNRTLLAVGNHDRTIRLLDIGKSDPNKLEWAVQDALKGHSHRVVALAFSRDGNKLASGGWDRAIRVWNSGANRDLESPVEKHLDAVRALAFSVDRTLLATGCGDGTKDREGTAKLWNLKSGQVTTLKHEKTCQVYAVAFSPDNGLATLVTGGSDGLLRLWKTPTGEKQGELPAFPDDEKVLSLAFARDGTTLAVGGSKGSIRLFRLETNGLLPVTSAEHRHQNNVMQLAFSPVDQMLSSASHDGTVRMWKVKQTGGEVSVEQSGGSVLTSPTNSANAWSVSFSPDGKILAAGFRDGLIRLWDVKTRRVVSDFQYGYGEVTSVTFSADGRTLASCSGESEIRLWNLRTRRNDAILRGDGGERFTQVGFAPGEKGQNSTLVSGSRDGTVRFWRAATDDEVRARSDRH